MNLKHIVLFFLIFTKGLCQEGSRNKVISKDDYSIEYPSKWKLDETGRNGAEFYLFHSLTPGKFGNNINLLIQNLNGMGLTLQSYTEISEKQINTNGKLISSQKKTANGKEYQEVKFEAFYNGYDVKFLQRYFIKGEKAYILTFTALKNEFDDVLPEATEIMDNFKI